VFQQCEVTYTPIFLGGLMKACNNTPPIMVKNKDKWIAIERLRWARLFNIPMCEEIPEGFPPMTLAVQRALCALAIERPSAVPAALDALYHALWVERQPIQNKDVAISILAKGLDVSADEAKSLFEKGASTEAKALLAKNTDLAFSEGAFGLPWFVGKYTTFSAVVSEGCKLI
jgi:2-hydroxychromene-2-carboxylate isomerase